MKITTGHFPSSLTRLAKALHYVIHYANKLNLTLNATRLLKIIFFAEVKALYEGVGLISKVKMVKARSGPVPDQHKEALNWLVRENKIIPTKRSNGMSYRSLFEPNVSLFTINQINILSNITSLIGDNFTAGMISGNIHENRIWNLVKMGQEIPLAAYLPGSETCLKLTKEELISFTT
ncbi:MAG: hypothetical protein LBS60_10880 [Deltaproteobacteria bacterium]|jgi:hypothetical protein|nr:hypothetical protein [Deltaproteobacteria bacterium]